MNWQKIIRDLQSAGVTQVQIAEKCKTRQSTISDLANGRTEQPRYQIGATLIEMHRASTRRAAREAA